MRPSSTISTFEFSYFNQFQKELDYYAEAKGDALRCHCQCAAFSQKYFQFTYIEFLSTFR